MPTLVMPSVLLSEDVLVLMHIVNRQDGVGSKYGCG
jgi:hypothetical protein